MRLRRMLTGFIPRHVPNALVLFLYDLFRGRGRVHLPEAVADAPREDRGSFYIEDQRRRDGERFGRSTVARAGCEVIALYNALLYLYGREVVSFPALIRFFARRGMVLGGLWGTSPKAIRGFLRRLAAQGTVEIAATASPSRFDAIGRAYPCLILSFYNDGGDILRGVHTVCLTREQDGFIAHNLTEDGRAQGPFGDVRGALDTAGGGRARGLYLIGARPGLAYR